jgi:hypothetical protein
MMSGWLFWMLVAFVIWRVVWARGCRARGRGRLDEYRGGSLGVEERESYIDALETRVSDLEARLDFTERLLAGRREMAG